MEGRRCLLASLLLPLLLSSSASTPPVNPIYDGLRRPPFLPSSEFINSSCWATSFPELCTRSLSSYASMVQQSPRRLARAALTVSLTRARRATDFIAKLDSHPAVDKTGLSLRERGAIEDCVATLADSVDRLSQSIGEVENLGQTQFRWHMSNVQTWVSAALTDQHTCMDGFGGVGMKGSMVRDLVRGEVVGVTRVTSNALAIVNKLAGRKF